MITSFKFRTSMFFVVALIGAAAFSARSGGVSTSVTGIRPAAIEVLTTTSVSAHIISTSPLSTIGDGHNDSSWKYEKNDERHGRDYDRDHDGDKDHDTRHGDDDHAPAPAPEPNTLLSFGIALAIGAGALFLRRIPGVRK